MACTFAIWRIRSLMASMLSQSPVEFSPVLLLCSWFSTNRRNHHYTITCIDLTSHHRHWPRFRLTSYISTGVWTHHCSLLALHIPWGVVVNRPSCETTSSMNVNRLIRNNDRTITSTTIVCVTIISYKFRAIVSYICQRIIQISAIKQLVPLQYNVLRHSKKKKTQICICWAIRLP
jgi:hypothetical protein